MPLSHTLKSFKNWFFRWPLKKKRREFPPPPLKYSPKCSARFGRVEIHLTFGCNLGNFCFYVNVGSCILWMPSPKKQIHKSGFPNFKTTCLIFSYSTWNKIKISFQKKKKLWPQLRGIWGTKPTTPWQIPQHRLPSWQTSRFSPWRLSSGLHTRSHCLWGFSLPPPPPSSFLSSWSEIVQ